MKNSIYISSYEKHTGSLVFSIGVFHHLKKLFDKVGFFRPISANHNNIELINQYFGIEEEIDNCYGVDIQTAQQLVSEDRIDDLSSIILDKYNSYKKRYDFVLLQGFNHSRFDFTLSKDFNIELAKNLDSVFVSILNGYGKNISSIKKMLKINKKHITESKVSSLYTVVTRVKQEYIQKLNSSDKKVLFIRQCEKINYLSIQSIKEHLQCDVIFNKEELIESYVANKVIANTDITSLVLNINKNDLLIISKDRVDILLAVLYSQNSKDVNKIGAILLTNGSLSKETMSLLDGISSLQTTILSTKIDTYQVVQILEKIEPKLTKNENRKIQYAIDLSQEVLELDTFKKDLNIEYEDIMTPFMFEHYICELAKQNIQTIVLPESSDDRILKASSYLQNKNLVNIILLGNSDEIVNQATTLGLDITKIKIINPSTSKIKPIMSKELFALRKHKGVTQERANDLLEDYTYFATMMVQMGYSDGMVSGAIHTTANTIRPALQIIKTKKDIDIVSSVFFMCMDTKVLIFGDCAINQTPNAKELAQIAISSAKSAVEFGFEPKIALMSYSSGSSGAGKDVEKVQEATQILKDTTDLLVEGPLQYDSAIDKKVGSLKMPNSKVAGRANILIFPDLNTGNNTYKAVQRSSNAIAIGPVLQGLNKPVNDLSRGCGVKDIINTVIITAIQGMKA